MRVARLAKLADHFLKNEFSAAAAAEIDDNDDDDYTSDELLSESVEHRVYTKKPPTIVIPPPSPTVPATFHRRRHCVDQAPNCFYLKSLCYNTFYQPIMERNCRKTCGCR